MLKSRTTEPLARFSAVVKEQPLETVEPAKLFQSLELQTGVVGHRDPKRALDVVCQYLNQDIQDALSHFFFEPNDASTRSYLAGLLKLRLQAYKEHNCLSEYQVVCDERNNPPAVIDASDIVIDINVQLDGASESWRHNVHGCTRKL